MASKAFAQNDMMISTTEAKVIMHAMHYRSLLRAFPELRRDQNFVDLMNDVGDWLSLRRTGQTDAAHRIQEDMQIDMARSAISLGHIQPGFENGGLGEVLEERPIAVAGSVTRALALLVGSSAHPDVRGWLGGVIATQICHYLSLHVGEPFRMGQKRSQQRSIDRTLDKVENLCGAFVRHVERAVTVDGKQRTPAKTPELRTIRRLMRA